MVYLFVFKVDGACRGNGQYGARGGCGVARIHRNGHATGWSYKVEEPPTVTNQRAELTAVKRALEMTIQKRRYRTKYRVEIKTDSRYAVGCMTDWINKWRDNGWINSKGTDVANQDLIMEIDELWDDIIEDGGRVRFTWIPRSENEFADELANDALDE